MMRVTTAVLCVLLVMVMGAGVIIGSRVSQDPIPEMAEDAP